MLQKPSDHIQNCLHRAEDAKRLAESTADSEQKADYLRLEQSWIRLARNYELTEQIERFLLNAGTAKTLIWHWRILEAQGFLALLGGHKEFSQQRSVSLARDGSYEVRLVELRGTSQEGTGQLWLELFDVHHNQSIDSYACHNLEDTARVAELLFSMAKNSNESAD